MRQRRQPALGGPAGAGDVVLVDDQRLRIELSDVGRDPVPVLPDDDDEVLRLGAAGRVRGRARAGYRPPMRCSTFGVADLIRVPPPAASTMTAAGRVGVTGVSLLGCVVGWVAGWRLAVLAPLPGFDPGPQASKARGLPGYPTGDCVE